jgi:hypothetical protein
MTVEPLEPIYTLRQAADLVPMSSVGALQKWLYRYANHFPRRYRYLGRGHRKFRVLLQSEILAVQATLIRQANSSRPSVVRSHNR